MSFPETNSFVYSKSPLRSVICQIRFPKILRIESEIPVAFQDHIRDSYPIFKEGSATQDVPQVPPEFQQLLNLQNPRAYEFLSRDEHWAVALTSDFLALTSKQYIRWLQFREQFQIPFKALDETYKPSFFSRIGLRYQDIIKKSAIGIDTKTPWKELLNPLIVGELSDDNVVYAIRERGVNILIELEGDLGVVRLRHGIGFDNSDGEQIYFIDSDFFVESQTETGDVFNVLDKFNNNARNLFRWCISDKLHSAMDPEPK